MSTRKQKMLALAILPMVGAFALGPLDVSAKEFEGGRRGGEERMFSMHHGEHAENKTELHDQDVRGMLKDHGRHRGWFMKNDEARTWMTDVFNSIKDGNYDVFQDKTEDTPLGDATNEDTFNSLAEASDAIESGDRSEAHSIMQTLRDDGYRFKKLIHDSLEQLFPKES